MGARESECGLCGGWALVGGRSQTMEPADADDGISKPAVARTAEHPRRMVLCPRKASGVDVDEGGTGRRHGAGIACGG